MARGPAFVTPNLGAKSYCTVESPAASAGYVPAGMPLSNLKTEEPSEPTRITVLDPLYTQLALTFKKTGKDVGGAGLWNIKLSPWGRYRFISQSGLSFSESAPDAIPSSTNMSGVVGNIDEAISSPDASYVSPTVTTSAWDFQLDFATPGVAPAFGGTKAMFVVRAILVGAPTTRYPRIAVNPMAGASSQGPVAVRAVSVSTGTGQVFIFPFNLEAGVYAANGSDIRMFASMEPGDSGSYAKIDAAWLYTESTTPPTYDSGWLDSPTGSYTDEDGPQPATGIAYWPSSAWASVTAVGLLIADDQTDHDPNEGTAGNGIPIVNISQTPTGYIDAGVFLAGPAVVLSRGIRHGSGPLTRILVEERGGVTEGGQTYGTDAFRRRALTMDLLVTQDELLTLQNRLPWRRGHSGAVLFSADPDLGVLRQQFLSFLATVREMGDGAPLPVRYASDGTMLHSVSLSLEEKL